MNMNEIKDLTLEEEELVAGCTVDECTDLQQAFTDCKSIDWLVSIGGHTPGVNLVGKAALESDLGKVGVDADLSVGFLGTGIGSSANKYYKKGTKQELTHQEVLNVIRNF